MFSLQAATIVTKADTTKLSPNILIERYQGGAEGDSGTLNKTQEDCDSAVESGSPSWFLPSMPQAAPLPEDKCNLLSGLF